MKTILSTLIIGTGLVLGGCRDNQEAEKDNNKENAQQIQNIDTNKLISLSLKFTALELYKQGQELDSLNDFYEIMDKNSDIRIDSLKKNLRYN